MTDFICINLKALISSTGLFIDIIGVFFVFFYGVPTQIDGARLKFRHADDSEQFLGEDYGKRSYLGPFLLIIGFSIQIIVNWV